MQADSVTIISVIVTFILSLIGGYVWFKRGLTKAKQVAKLVNEFADVIVAVKDEVQSIVEAAEDQDVSPEEVQEIIIRGKRVYQEYQEFVESIRRLLEW